MDAPLLAIYSRSREHGCRDVLSWTLADCDEVLGLTSAVLDDTPLALEDSRRHLRDPLKWQSILDAFEFEVADHATPSQLAHVAEAFPARATELGHAPDLAFRIPVAREVSPADN